jgi:transketolase
MTQTVDQSTRVADLAAAADRIRHHILNMGEVQGQGYVGQGLGFADVLAVIQKGTLLPIGH